MQPLHIGPAKSTAWAAGPAPIETQSQRGRARVKLSDASNDVRTDGADAREVRMTSVKGVPQLQITGITSVIVRAPLTSLRIGRHTSERPLACSLTAGSNLRAPA